MKKKSLGVNATLNGLRSILNILFPVITFPYVSRVLGANSLGIYNFSNSVISYFVLIAGLGINTYAVREGAKYRDNKTKISKFSSEVFTINIYSTLLAYILLFLSLFLFYRLRNYTSCILVFSIQILFTTIGTEWIYQIYEEYLYITIRSILFNIISILLLFIFVRNSNNYLEYAAITVFSSVGANIINFIGAKRFCSIKVLKNANLSKHLKPILVIFSATLAAMIYINSDVTLLGLMKNNVTVGIYSVSAKIYSIVQTFISSVYIVTVPRLALYLGKNRFKEYSGLLTKVINNIILLILPAMTGLYMLSKEVIIIISGQEFIRATSSLRILCFSLIFSTLAGSLYQCILIPAKREKYVLKSTIISAVLNILLNILLIPLWAENAAAFSTLISEIVIVLLDLYYSKDLSAKIFRSKKFIKNVVEAMIGCIGIVIECSLIELAFPNLLLKTIFSITFSVLIYISILILLGNETAISILYKLRKK